MRVKTSMFVILLGLSLVLPATLLAQEPTAANTLQPAQIWMVQPVGNNVQDVAFSPDGKIIAATATLTSPPQNNIVLLNTADGTLRHELVGHSGLIDRIAFSPDGTLLASTSSDGSLRLWNIADGTEKLNIQLTGQLKSLAFNPAGTSLFFMTNSNPNTIWQLDVAAGKEQIIYSRDDASFSVNGLILSPDGNMVVLDATESIDNEAHAVIYQLDQIVQTETKVFDQPASHPLDIFYSAHGKLLVAITPDGSMTTQVWDVEANNLLYTLPPAQTSDGSEVATTRAVLNPAGTILATASIGTEVQLFEAQTGTLLGILNRNKEAGQDGPQGIAFSQNGTWVATSYLYGGIYLWDLIPQAQTPTDSAPTATPTETGSGTCTITATKPANLRGGPDTSYPKSGSLMVGQTVEITGQAQSADGKTWYRTTSTKWIRSDLVDAPAECASVTILTP